MQKTGLWKNLLCATLCAILVAGCTSISAKEKTIVLQEPLPTPVESPNPGAKSYEIRKMYPVSFEKLDPDGLTENLAQAVHGWADNDNLLCMSVKYATDANGEQTGDLLSEIARLSYQYSFWDPILSIENTRITGFDTNDALSLIAVNTEEILTIYETGNQSAIATKSREQFASAPLFASDERAVFFASTGDVKQIERFDPYSGTIETLSAGKVICPLAQNESGMLWIRRGSKEDVVGLSLAPMSEFEPQLTGAQVGSVQMLDGAGLVVYDDVLTLLTDEDATPVLQDTTAFALTQDRVHIAYARKNAAGSVDILVGYWGNTKPINEKLVYKDLNVQMQRMCFSPDGRKLYVQGTKDKVLVAYVFEFV